jgi:hypothetical protein
MQANQKKIISKFDTASAVITHDKLRMHSTSTKLFVQAQAAEEEEE